MILVIGFWKLLSIRFLSTEKIKKMDLADFLCKNSAVISAGKAGLKR